MIRYAKTLTALAIAGMLTTGLALAGSPKAGKGTAAESDSNAPVAERDERPRHGRPDGHFGPGGPGGPGGGVERLVKFWEDEELASQLNLTADQVTQLNASYDTTKAAVEETKGNIVEAHEALRGKVEVDNPNIEEVNAAIDAVTAAENEKMHLLFGHRVVVKNVLTSEQEEILKDQRHDRGREVVKEIREAAKELRGSIKELAADGELSDADWSTIDSRLTDLEPKMRERIEKRIQSFEQRLESGEMPPPAEGLEFDGPRHGRRHGFKGGDREAPEAPDASEPMPPLPEA